MFLGIDIGNTQIVLGLIDNSGKTVQSWRINTKLARTMDEYAALTKALLEFKGKSLADISVMAISSVVPHVTEHWAAMNEKYIGAEYLEINYNHLKGYSWDIDNPQEVGADRLCNIIAGYEKYGGPLIVLDFGTAITFDVISGDKTYLGGAILPGLETTMSTLHAKAAKLPSVSLDFPKNIIGKNTIEHIQSGLMFGTAAMVDGMIERMREEMGAKARVIATGGLAEKIAPYTKSVEKIESDLILDGLYMIWQLNRGER